MRSIAFFAPYIITQEKIFFNIQRKYLHLLRFCSIIKEIVILSFEQGETIMVLLDELRVTMSDYRKDLKELYEVLGI